MTANYIHIRLVDNWLFLALDNQLCHYLCLGRFSPVTPVFSFVYIFLIDFESCLLMIWTKPTDQPIEIQKAIKSLTRIKLTDV